MTQIVGGLAIAMQVDRAGLANSLKASGTDLNRYERAANNNFRRMDENANRRFSSMGRAAEMFSRRAMMAGTAMVAAFGLMVRSSIQTADQMGKMAQSIGVGVEELSRLNHAADLSGVSLSQLRTGVQQLSRQLKDAAENGSGAAAKSFRDLGIAVTDANGKARSTTDIFGDIAEVVSSMPEGFERTGLAMKIFGRSGAELIPLLAQGRAGIREMMEEADRLGITISKEFASQAAEFNDNMTRLGAGARGLAQSISGAALPSLIAGTEGLLSFSEGVRNFEHTGKLFAATVLLMASRVVGPFVSAQAAGALALARKSAALIAHTRNLNLATASTAALTAASRTLAASMALVGGPAGAGIIAVGGALYLASQRAQEARDRSQRYADVIKQAGEDSRFASTGIREAAAALTEVEESATSAETAIRRGMAMADLAAFATQMSGKIQQLGTSMGWASIEIQNELQRLRQAFFDGQMSAEDFISEVDRISETYPDATPVIAEIQRIAREAAAAWGIIDGLNRAAAQIGQTTAKSDRLGAPEPLGDLEFYKRFNAGWGELAENLNRAATAGRRAGGGISAAGDAARRAEQDLNRLKSAADMLAESLFPGEYARREAEELSGLLQRFGDQLDPYQLAAVQRRIEVLLASAAAGVRDLDRDFKDFGENAAENIEKTLGNVLSDLFTRPVKDLDEFVDRVMSAFAQIGQANLQKAFEGLFPTTPTPANQNFQWDGLQGAVQSGAEKGTRRGGWAGIIDGFTSLFGGEGFQGGASGMGGLGGMASAGFGGLGMGYQSQSPLMGGLSGAISGFMATGNPLGAIVGARGGRMGALFQQEEIA